MSPPGSFRDPLSIIAMIRERPDEERWELLDGEAVLMAPPSERHQQIVSNLLAALRPLVAKFGCRALPGLGLRNDFVDDYAPIPDVVVRCGPLLTDGYARDPLVVAEVLSPSTLNNDRGRKAAFYQAGCASCHVPKFVTSRDAPNPAHRFQLLWPYADFLLHDMGEGLADHRPEGQAESQYGLQKKFPVNALSWLPGATPAKARGSNRSRSRVLERAISF